MEQARLIPTIIRIPKATANVCRFVLAIKFCCDRDSIDSFNVLNKISNPFNK